jgi:hypothetical protein
MSCGGWRDFGGDAFAEFRLGDLQLVCRLQIEPEARAVAEITGQALAVSVTRRAFRSRCR